MARYNFIKDGVSKTLDMTAGFTALYFIGGDLTYEDADFYAYYDFSDFTPSGSIDSGYIVDPPNYQARQIKAIPHRGLKIEKNNNCTLNLYWSTDLNTPFYSTGSSYSGKYDGLDHRGFSARRQGIHWTCSCYSGYIFLDGTTYKEGDIDFFTDTFVNEIISGSDCEWWYSIPALITKTATCNVYFTKGTGVSDLWIYDTNNPTPGSTRYDSGDALPRGSTVYLCVSWQTGYKPPNNQWYERNTAIGYIRYKIINVPNQGSYDLGTINMVVAESYLEKSFGSSLSVSSQTVTVEATTYNMTDSTYHYYIKTTQDVINKWLRWGASGPGTTITRQDSIYLYLNVSKSAGPSITAYYYYTDTSWTPLT